MELGVAEEYGDEDGAMEDYGEEAFEQPDPKGKKGKKKKEKDMAFASYEDFAQLIEQGMEEEKSAKNDRSFLKKRSFSQTGARSKSGNQKKFRK